MAINPETLYVGKIKPASAPYPYGEAQDITLPSDGTGTPWKASFVNDLFGFQQSLLSEAGIIPSGTPDQVGASQYLDAAKTIMGVVFKTKTAAIADVSVQAFTAADAGRKLFITGSDGGHFVVEYNAVLATYSDNGGAYAGTQFIPTGGDGTIGIVRIFTGNIDVKWFGIVGDATDETAELLLASSLNIPIYIDESLIVGITSLTMAVSVYGKGTIKPLVTGSTYAMTLSNDVVLDDISFDVSIDGAAIRTINFAATSGVKILNCKVTGTAADISLTHVLWGDGATDYRVTGNEFDTMYAECVRAAVSDGGIITENRFKNIEKQSTFLNRCIIIGSGSNCIINNNIFEDVGTNGIANINDVCCIDVGNTINTIVNGNLATNVHSFIDIETSTGTEHNIAVTGNTVEGLVKLSVGAEGKGLWVNFATSPSNGVVFSGNSVSYFKAGITATSCFDITVSGNRVTNCVNSITFAASRKFSCVGNLISNGTTAIDISQVAGFGGGVVSGNTILAHTTSIQTVVTGVGTEEDRIIVSNNLLQGGTLNYGSTQDIKEFGNTYTDGSSNLADGDTTPSIVGVEQVYTANTGATTITAFDIPFGEEKTIVVNDNNTTINFTLAALHGNGGVSYTATAGDMLLIKRKFNNGYVGITIIK